MIDNGGRPECRAVCAATRLARTQPDLDLYVSVRQQARLLALVNVAMADAGITRWEAKYKFNSWRPVTAIRRAAEDGNPATTGDSDWQPLLVTPAFPEYVSGHGTFSAAAGEVLLDPLDATISLQRHK